MILTRVDVIAYRVHAPKWSFAPTSGAGAGKHGGRANRPGIDALYLSLDLETALSEYKGLGPLLPPALMVSYRISAGPLVDFRGGYMEDWDPLWEDFYCDWRKLHFNEGIEPPSWVIGDHVIAAGAKGIMFNSALVTGVNLVLYDDALNGDDRIDVHDPNHALPKNQASWE